MRYVNIAITYKFSVSASAFLRWVKIKPVAAVVTLQILKHDPLKCGDFSLTSRNKAIYFVLSLMTFWIRNQHRSVPGNCNENERHRQPVIS